MTVDRRLLLVHAHPDDETINNGATMAYYAAAGAQVTLVTCTLGEFGEILVPGLIELEWDKGDQLGGYRAGELAEAMRALGVTDHRFLGGAGRFSDSGMMGTPANERPRAFWRANTDEQVFAAAVRALVDVIREVRPQVVVTYDPFGGYGHPDHIMAHRVATAAVPAAADAEYDAAGEPWAVAKLYWATLSRSVLQAGLDALRAAGETFFELRRAEDFPGAVDDAEITTVIDAAEFAAAKTAAMRAHASQIAVDGPFFALSNNLGMKVWGVEHYRLIHGEAGGERDADGRETDLFGGI